MVLHEIEPKEADHHCSERHFFFSPSLLANRNYLSLLSGPGDKIVDFFCILRFSLPPASLSLALFLSLSLCVCLICYVF